jgi:hypothetical protein
MERQDDATHVNAARNILSVGRCSPIPVDNSVHNRFVVIKT